MREKLAWGPVPRSGPKGSKEKRGGRGRIGREKGKEGEERERRGEGKGKKMRKVKGKSIVCMTTHDNAGCKKSNKMKGNRT